ncbi:MAG TPA: hypothetical protein PKA60_00560 [Candidatus Paceibacterota bacterium]|nr:hypothetical protein [Candidatus Paceibacterota bacterium]
MKRTFKSERSLIVKNIKAQTSVREIPLSDEVIPSVQGELYIYGTELSPQRPIYALMKCKANKNRPTKSLRQLGKEANLVFLFDGENVSVMSILDAIKRGELEAGIGGELSTETRIAPAGISKHEFLEMCASENVGAMITCCELACEASRVRISLGSGMVIAVFTEDGKCGLFLVDSINQERHIVHLKAFHILK